MKSSSPTKGPSQGFDPSEHRGNPASGFAEAEIEK